MKKIYGGIIISLAILICFFIFKRSKSPTEKTIHNQSTEGIQTADSESEALNIKNPAGVTILEDFSGDYMIGYGDPQNTIHADLAIVIDLLDSFNTLLKGRTTLPAATNQELVKALLGDNNDRIRFISSESKALNEKKELIDRWGTPLFFHFENEIMPEIRSAGPDKKMWNDDDTVLDVLRDE